VAGRSGNRGGGGGPARQRRGRRRKGDGVRLTGGAGVSVEERNRERGRRGLGRCGEKDGGCWVVGPNGKEGKFLFFSFSNSFQIKLFLSNSNQNSSNLFTKLYKLFRSHTSNQKPCKYK
jgi:hypothetical protein